MKIQHRQLLEEQLPIRARQLLDVYGPDGIQPLLPERQSTVDLAVPLVPSQTAVPPRVQSDRLSSQLHVGFGGGQVGSKSNSGTPCDTPLHVWISSYGNSPTDEAIDLSGWRLQGSLNFTLPPGTVSRIGIKGHRIRPPVKLCARTSDSICEGARRICFPAREKESKWDRTYLTLNLPRGILSMLMFLRVATVPFALSRCFRPGHVC
jgi:hypothetical protein